LSEIKILISDNLSKQGVEILQKAGLTVDVKTKMSKEELLRDIKNYDGLIVRSGTKVTADVLAVLQADIRPTRMRCVTLPLSVLAAALNGKR